MFFATGVKGQAPSTARQYFAKPLRWDGSAVALVLMNHAIQPLNMEVRFEHVPWLKCPTESFKVRDIWQREDVGIYQTGFRVDDLAGHDAAFLHVSCAHHDSHHHHHHHRARSHRQKVEDTKSAKQGSPVDIPH